MRVLMSIHPQYVDAIFAGAKSVELRRKAPINVTEILIYETSPRKALVGRVPVSTVVEAGVEEIWADFGDKASIDQASFNTYFSGKLKGYAIQLGQPEKFDKAIELESMREEFGIQPPQSWRYMNAEEVDRVTRFAAYPN